MAAGDDCVAWVIGELARNLRQDSIDNSVPAEDIQASVTVAEDNKELVCLRVQESCVRGCAILF